MTLSSGVINIGPTEQRKRRIAGTTALMVASALLLWLDLSHASRWWRLGALPLWWVAALGFLQARAGTCVMLAARGECRVDGRDPFAPSPADALVLTGRARTIVRRATLVAAIVTLATLAFP